MDKNTAYKWLYSYIVESFVLKGVSNCLKVDRRLMTSLLSLATMLPSLHSSLSPRATQALCNAV